MYWTRPRIIMVTVLLVLSVLVLPSLLRLPEHWPTLADWRPMSPVKTLQLLLAPEGPQEGHVRQAWAWLQLFVLAAVLAVTVPPATRRQKGGVPDPDESGAHGTARWRTPAQLKDALTPWRIGYGRPPVGILAGVDRANRPRSAYYVAGLNHDSPVNPHVLVLGASGSGKTRRLVLPTLWSTGRARQNSIILTDPKGELYSLTAEFFRQRGYQVRTLNLIDPRRSDKWNPMHEIVGALHTGDESRASELAWNLAYTLVYPDPDQKSHDPFWEEASQSLIAGLCLYVAGHESVKTLGRVYQVLATGGEDALDTVFRQLRRADPARLAAGPALAASDRTRSSIVTTTLTKLRLFADPVVDELTSGQDYELKSIGQQPTAVYLLLPDDISTRNTIAAQYIAQSYSALRQLARDSPGGRLPFPAYWLLDEFANLGKFKDFEKMISVMRGAAMGVMIVLQAMQQLHAVYGKEVGEIIAGNCDSWLFLSTNDLDTAQTVSKKLGEYTMRTHTAGSSTGAQAQSRASFSTNEQLGGRPLLTADEVLRWPRGQALLMQAGQLPARLALADITKWPARFQDHGPPPIRPPAQDQGPLSVHPPTSDASQSPSEGDIDISSVDHGEPPDKPFYDFE